MYLVYMLYNKLSYSTQRRNINPTYGSPKQVVFGTHSNRRNNIYVRGHRQSGNSLTKVEYKVNKTPKLGNFIIPDNIPNIQLTISEIVPSK